MRALIIADSEEIPLLISQYLAIEWPQVEVEEEITLSPPQAKWKDYDVIVIGTERDETLQRWFAQHRVQLSVQIKELPLVFIASSNAGKQFILNAGGICVAQSELNRSTLASAIKAAQKKGDDSTLDLTETGGNQALRAAIQEAAADNVAVHRDTGKAIKIRGYRLRKKVGEGGMSTVYLAERAEDRTQVVLKILDNKLTQDEEQLRRFMYEFSIISEFDSPYVIHIFDQGFTDDHVFIAMEYFSHGDLKQRMQNPVERREALRILFHIACALEVIHARGIIHRDLKPQNIMFRADSTLALADFGISKNTAVETEAETTIMGTPFYISPEIISGHPADERSDLYSLGIIFYEMLMGQRPYEATSVMMLLYKHTNDPIPRLPGQYAEFQEVLDRLLAKRPESRFRNAGTLIDYLVKRWHSELSQ